MSRITSFLQVDRGCGISELFLCPKKVPLVVLLENTFSIESVFGEPMSI